MKYRNWLLVSAAAGLAAVVATSPAHAVKTGVDGYFYELAAGADKNLDAVRTLIKASDAHGLTRNNGTGTNCFGCTLVSHELKGTGTYNGVANADVMIDFDYRIQAIRADVTPKADAKSRTVTVAARGIAWDESKPGYFLKAGTQPLDRLVWVYILPTQAVIAAGLAGDKITVAAAGANKVLTIPIPQYMTNLKATVDPKGFIVATEMVWGGKTYTGEYSSFGNDRMDNHVFLPDRIIQKVDGKVMTDLTLEYHWSMPYMLFRPPAEMAAK
jgi:hypothetical protein